MPRDGTKLTPQEAALKWHFIRSFWIGMEDVLGEISPSGNIKWIGPPPPTRLTKKSFQLADIAAPSARPRVQPSRPLAEEVQQKAQEKLESIEENRALAALNL